MLDWWLDEQGRNLLSGIPEDEDNPALLADEFIISFLFQYPLARTSFNHLFPSMLAEEQARLQGILDAHPFLSEGFAPDPQSQTDALQRRENTIGFQTTGPKGGTRRG